MGQFNGNTTFYQRAAVNKLSFKDIFSGVFKKHKKGDGARQFMAGTVLSTPAPGELLQTWQRPWIFARVGLVGLLFIVGLTITTFLLADQEPAVTTFGAMVMPLAVLMFFWEMNIPRNVPIYEVLAIFFIGGTISMVVLYFLIPLKMGLPPWSAPIAEEPAKLLAILPFLAMRAKKNGRVYIFNGILIGAAVGAGFEVFESAGYNMSSWMGSGNWDGIHTMLLRSLPNTHLMWGALYGGALAWAMGSGPLKARQLLQPRFLGYFFATWVIHAFNNQDVLVDFFLDLMLNSKYDISLTQAYAIELPPAVITSVISTIRQVSWIEGAITTIACWALMLPLLRAAIQQVLLTVNESGQMPLPEGVLRYVLYGKSGPYAGQSIPISGTVRLGREPQSCNLLFSAETKGVSRRHCTVNIQSGGVTLTDDGSSQGTFLAGGQKVSAGQPVALQEGQQFYLAVPENTFELRRQS